MPDLHRIEREVAELLSKPIYGGLFLRVNQFAKPGSPPVTPQTVARRTAEDLVRNRPLLDPVEVVEIRGRMEFYRMHDGGEQLTSARTLGRSWTERSVVETIWRGTARYSGEERRRVFVEFLRSSNFVLPEWNSMKFLVCMTVPAGGSIVALRGRGDWRAMRTPQGGARPGGAPGIQKASDVLDVGMMPLAGLEQCFVPLLNDMWIQPVPAGWHMWPFAT